LLAFDAPGREECTAERVNSNPPLQALVLLNDPTYVEAARVFAEQIVRKGGKSASDRMNWTFARVLSRKPKPNELRILNELYRQELVRYTADRSSADQVMTAGEWPVPRDLNISEVAAWTSVARVVLNLHETITRY